MSKKRRDVPPSHQLGDAPIEGAYRDKMNELAHTLDYYFNGGLWGEARQVGFVLLVFEFGDTGRANYISNAERADVVTLLKEQIKRFEGQPEMKGTA